MLTGLTEAQFVGAPKLEEALEDIRRKILTPDDTKGHSVYHGTQCCLAFMVCEDA